MSLMLRSPLEVTIRKILEEKPEQAYAELNYGLSMMVETYVELGEVFSDMRANAEEQIDINYGINISTRQISIYPRVTNEMMNDMEEQVKLISGFHYLGQDIRKVMKVMKTLRSEHPQLDTSYEDKQTQLSQEIPYQD